MRIRHIAMVTSDLERSADLYESVFGFKRMGEVRKPGNLLAMPGRTTQALRVPQDVRSRSARYCLTTACSASPSTMITGVPERRRAQSSRMASRAASTVAATVALCLPLGRRSIIVVPSRLRW
jgi:catechol 2,3-dioxygenase-like lactoylglutathione lyase family enzyme